MKLKSAFVLMLAAAIGLSAPAHAGWTVMPHGQPVTVAKSMFRITPLKDWNKSSRRPSSKGEMWTLDGPALNELSFYAGIANGETIVKDRMKKDRPLPKFRSDMLPPDLVQLIESTTRISLDTSMFEVDSIQPTKLAGHDAVHFTYHYVVQSDEVRRKGEARAAVIDGKLYLINFVAPALHYFDQNIDEVRAIMDNAAL